MKGPSDDGREDTLLEGKAQANTRGRFGNTALMVAVSWKKTSKKQNTVTGCYRPIVQSCFINQPFNLGPLVHQNRHVRHFFAAQAMYGHAEIVQLLLSAGAQVNTNGDGETAIDLAYRYPNVAEILQRHVEIYGWTGQAAKKGMASWENLDGNYLICLYLSRSRILTFLL